MKAALGLPKIEKSDFLAVFFLLFTSLTGMELFIPNWLESAFVLVLLLLEATAGDGEVERHVGEAREDGEFEFFRFGFCFEEAGLEGEGGGVATCFFLFFFDVGGSKNPVVIN